MIQLNLIVPSYFTKLHLDRWSLFKRTFIELAILVGLYGNPYFS
jgi:hypothetical protein